MHDGYNFFLKFCPLCVFLRITVCLEDISFNQNGCFIGI